MEGYAGHRPRKGESSSVFARLLAQRAPPAAASRSANSHQQRTPLQRTPPGGLQRFTSFDATLLERVEGDVKAAAGTVAADESAGGPQPASEAQRVASEAVWCSSLHPSPARSSETAGGGSGEAVGGSSGEAAGGGSGEAAGAGVEGSADEQQSSRGGAHLGGSSGTAEVRGSPRQLCLLIGA